jgi:MFS family permease
VADKWLSFRSLRNPIFRSYFTGVALTRIGNWTQDVAQSWFVFRETGSGTAVGSLLACEFVPILLLTLWAGSVIDRHSRRSILIITQIAFIALALLLALVTGTGGWIGFLFVIATLRGVVAAFNIPAGGAFIAEIVPAEDMRSASSLNGAIFNFGRILGALFATGLVGLTGTSACFVVNAFTYAVLLAMLLRIHPQHVNAAPRAEGARVFEGLKYAWHRSELRAACVVMFGVGMMAYNSQVFFPLLADDVFHKGLNTYAYLLAIYSCGFIIASLIGAAGRVPTNAMMLRSTALLGAMILLEAIVAPVPVVGVIVVLLWGCANGMFGSRINTLVQMNTEPHMKGRFMALWTIVVWGTTPLGAPLVGYLGSQFGARASLFVTSLVVFSCVAYAFVVLRQRSVSISA